MKPAVGLFFAMFLLAVTATAARAQNAVNYDDLEENGTETYYYMGRPFTGTAEGVTNTGDYTRVQFVNGIANGTYHGYYDPERTVVKWEVPYAKGKMHGKFVNYYPDGTVEFLAAMKNGELNGARYGYYPNGKLRLLQHYKDGKGDGVAKTYHENGRIYEKTLFKNGKKEGSYERYHENGTPHIKGWFVNDLEEGVWRQYDENGIFVREQVYLAGEVIAEP